MSLPLELKNYFEELNSKTVEAFEIAKKARSLGYDPDLVPEIQIAHNMAERVVGLVSVLAPQIADSEIANRIQELEKEYGILDWRVAFKIALEVGQQKYCKFEDEREAMEVGIRIGFAYVTNGVVSSPLEGFVNLELIDRMDRQGKFFRINFAGPVRNAGGTAAAVSVLIADYVRKHMGYAEYDPQPDEIKRCFSEIAHYHDRITNLQYHPHEAEIDFLVAHMPIEVAGDPTEKIEVPNYKNLPRVPTNKLRSGYCLIYSSCIPLKAPKLWKQLSKWGKEMEMEQWNFMEDYISIQKKATAGKSEKKSDEKIQPNFTYIADLVAGRPVFGHPLQAGGFRLRYGRSRLSGMSGQSMHPATTIVANEFIATASQLKVERPGKAAAYTVCDQIEGPIVKLKDGEVVQVHSSDQARAIKDKIDKILFLGDVLINYGDFLDRAHVLVPPGYCEEWWVQELKKAGASVPESLWKNPITTKVSFEEAFNFSKEHGVPLHPKFLFHYKLASVEDLRNLWESIRKAPHKDDLVLDLNAKKTLETIGVPHKVINEEIVVSGENAKALRTCFSKEAPTECEDSMEFMQEVSPVFIRDKSGVFIGSRLGRPEKAKMRKMTGSPHSLFPCGDEGGRLRSFNAALEVGRVTSNFEIYYCDSCQKEIALRRCPYCDSVGKELYSCKDCGTTTKTECVNGPHRKYKQFHISINDYMESCLKKMGSRVFPDLIKGVRGTSNEDHAAEHLIKGVLRARHDVHVNKDGTIRYDASEVPVTHFRPKEIGITFEQARKLGYVKDIHGKPLASDDQVIEMFPQDVILPACLESPDQPSDKILLNSANFVDELLQKLYGMDSYYNAESAADLIGHFIIALAPHTSAGTVGRIIGFSKTQGLFYHPYLHAATRRDCFTKETFIPICKDNKWELKQIGDLVEELNPQKIVDSFNTKETKPKGYFTLGVVDGKISKVPVQAFTKHAPQRIISINTKLGRKLRTTFNHKNIIIENGEEKIITSANLREGNTLKIPYNHPLPDQDIAEIDLLEELGDKDWLMVRGLKKSLPNLRRILVTQGVKQKAADNYSFRDSVPAKIAKKIIFHYSVDKKSLSLAARRDHITLPCIIPLTDDLLTCIGLYVAEGHARNQLGSKGSYQVYISGEKKQVRDHVKKTFSKLGLSPSDKKTDRVTYSSRILFELFTELLKAGDVAQNKRIPSKLLTLPKQRLGKLLGGYFEGDGSVSVSDLRITFDTVSKGLTQDLSFVLGRFGIFVKYYESTRQPGKRLKDFYIRKNREIPYFTCTRGIIQSKFFHQLSETMNFVSNEKKSIQQTLLATKKHKYLACEYDQDFFYDEIISIHEEPPEESYCLTVPNHYVVANGILTKQCDGDEGCVFLLMDAFLNFSKRFLPSTRGATMDAPLVLTTVLAPAEVDDMVLNVDVAWRYPLEFYEACQDWKMPWDVKIPIINDFLNTPEEFYGFGFTHDTSDLNDGNRCSAYKILPSMQEKLESQMDLANKLAAVDERDVAKLVIEKHFIRDIKGNLRKYSQQAFRCVKCNDSFRRPPLKGICGCGGRIIFTISEGSVVKYLTPAESLVKKYNLDLYLKQSIDLTRRRVEEVFGKDPEKQTGLGEWF